MKNQNKEKTMISRREALKTSTLMLGYALTASAATAVLNGCKADKAPDWMPSNMTLDQSKLIAEVAEMIIPATDIPGAKAALVDRFIDSMCEAYPEEERNMFIQGLSLFDTKAQAINQKSFLDSDEPGRKAVLDEMVAESKDSDEPHIFDMVKEMTVLGYCSSEIGATELLNYDPIPGPFVGCVDFSTVGATWAI